MLPLASKASCLFAVFVPDEEVQVAVAVDIAELEILRDVASARETHRRLVPEEPLAVAAADVDAWVTGN